MKTIEVYALEWWRKSVGGHYYATKVFVDGEHVGTTQITRGYGEQYIVDAMKILYDAGIVVDGDECSLWRYCELKGIKLVRRKMEVARERDLKAWVQHKNVI